MHQCSIGFVLWLIRLWFKTGNTWSGGPGNGGYDITLCWRISGVLLKTQFWQQIYYFDKWPYPDWNPPVQHPQPCGFMQPSMANLNSPSSRVVKDSTPFRRRILRCKNLGKGESWPSLFLDVVNLYLIKFRHRWILNERTFYSFIILFIWKWILT